jgi:hypothetical protein
VFLLCGGTLALYFSWRHVSLDLELKPADTI